MPCRWRSTARSGVLADEVLDAHLHGGRTITEGSRSFQRDQDRLPPAGLENDAFCASGAGEHERQDLAHGQRFGSSEIRYGVTRAGLRDPVAAELGKVAYVYDVIEQGLGISRFHFVARQRPRQGNREEVAMRALPYGPWESDRQTGGQSTRNTRLEEVLRIALRSAVRIQLPWRRVFRQWGHRDRPVG